MDNVISLDVNRISKEYINGRCYVKKKTTANEFENYKCFFPLPPVLIENKKYYIKIPNEISWDNNSNSLITSYCDGQNLESILCNYKTHADGVIYLNAIYQHMINNDFYWLDFAPRNIKITNNTIWIFDFERGIKKSTKDQYIFMTYEEYAAFLLIAERDISDAEYSNEILRCFDKCAFSSKRINNIIKKLNINWTRETYYRIYKFILYLEIPIKVQNEGYYFPIRYMEELLTENGYDKYVDFVISSNIECGKYVCDFVKMLPYEK